MENQPDNTIPKTPYHIRPLHLVLITLVVGLVVAGFIWSKKPNQFTSVNSLWQGKWEQNIDFNSGEDWGNSAPSAILTITNESAKEFSFNIDIQGWHVGQIEGVATKVSDTEAIFSASVLDADPKIYCTLKFTHYSSHISVVETTHHSDFEGCPAYAAVGASINFDGEYMKASELSTFKTDVHAGKYGSQTEPKYDKNGDVEWGEASWWITIYPKTDSSIIFYLDLNR